MTHGTPASRSAGQDDDTTVYETSWDFTFGEVLSGALGGKRQINKAILDYTEEFEKAARIAHAEKETVHVDRYDPVTQTEEEVTDPDHLYDELIDDVVINELELTYEHDGHELSFRYDTTDDDPFTVEVEGLDLVQPMEQQLGRGMGEKGREKGLLGLFG